MRIGQTSFVVFASKFVGSALGFVATIYFARELGAGVLGQYAMVVALVAWLRMGGHVGIASAMKKRMSEGEEPAAYAVASGLLIGGLGTLLAALVLLFGEHVNDYVGAAVAPFVAAILLVSLFEGFVSSGLSGERKVHLSGLLSPVGIGVRSLLQIGFLTAGLGLAAMLAGYAIGSLVVGLAGLALLSVGVVRPRRRHFRKLVEYARYSWLGALKARSFNDVDVLLLGVFLQSSLVGVYSAAWSIANFLTLFDSAVSSTLFPEFSHADARDSREAVADLVEQSLEYAGLFLAPGLVGGGLLAERLLRIYGPEFVGGATVLWVLILATLVYAYQKQLMNALNGVDRPDSAFRINVVFVVSNVVLNLALIPAFSVLGAAAATALSAGIGLVLAASALRAVVDFGVPVGELGKQALAAVLMGVAVWGVERLIETATPVNHNFGIVVALVGVGALTYFVTLAALSRSFRATVADNAPVDVPLIRE